MANVTLPTPVVLAGAGLCLLAGYLVGAVAGATDQVERRTADVVAYDATEQRVCLAGDAVTDLPGVDDEDVAAGVADRVAMALDAPIMVEGQERFVTASVGMRCAAAGELTSEEMLRDADAAMYRAKELGKDRSERFNTALRAVGLDGPTWFNDARGLLHVIGDGLGL